MNSIEIEYGSKVVLPHDIVRNGYTFIGWYDSNGVCYAGMSYVVNESDFYNPEFYWHYQDPFD